VVRLSDEVWKEIAKRGRFGESEDDVLRRVFGIKPSELGQSGVAPMPDAATARMHSRVYEAGTAKAYLKVRFENGDEQHFKLPADKSDKRAIRDALTGALLFGKKNGASRGQLFAIRKALTDMGYHLTK
jgi:hypothetical protein